MERKKYYEYRIAINKHITIKAKVEITIPVGDTIKEAVQELKEVIAEYHSKGKFQFTADDVKLTEIF